MKTVKVAAAVIVDTFAHPSRVFATARGYGENQGMWEFPGGKVEKGESSEQALIREIREELDVSIKVGPRITTVEYDYPAFHLSMDCFFCVVTEGRIVLKEAEAARWLGKEHLFDVPWLPADLKLIETIRQEMSDEC